MRVDYKKLTKIERRFLFWIRAIHVMCVAGIVVNIFGTLILFEGTTMYFLSQLFCIPIYVWSYMACTRSQGIAIIPMTILRAFQFILFVKIIGYIDWRFFLLTVVIDCLIIGVQMWDASTGMIRTDPIKDINFYGEGYDIEQILKK